MSVPNVPCGVESQTPEDSTYLTNSFLMYRVELKELLKEFTQTNKGVPNVPCGVESREMKYFRPFTPQFLMYRVELKDQLYSSSTPLRDYPFLMYRVELKEPYGVPGVPVPGMFLMYRVELKDNLAKCIPAFSVHVLAVPNVPCGVERWRGSAGK